MPNADDTRYDEDFAGAPREGLALPPWEQRETYGLLNGLYLTIKGVMLAPGRFFHRMPVGTGLGQPLFFAVVIGTAAAFVSWMWTLTGSSLQMLVNEDITGAFRAPLVSFGSFVLSPLLVSVLVTLQAVLIHGMLMVVGGNRLGFEATFRVCAYTEAASVLVLLPFCGSFVGTVWGLAAAVIGVYSIHETDPWRAVVAVLAPMLLCLAATGGALMLAVAGLG